MMISDHVFTNAVMSANQLTKESKRSYLKQLKQVKKVMKSKSFKTTVPKSQVDTLYYILMHPKQVMGIYENLLKTKKVSLNSAKSNMVALASLIKRAEESEIATPELLEKQKHWVQNVRVLNNQSQKIIEQNTLSEKEKEAWVPFSEWLSTERKLRETKPGSYAHLLVAFHTLVAPMRGGDLSKVKIIQSEDPNTKTKQNVLIWNGPKEPATLLIRSHKTSKKWPILKRELPTELKDALDISLKETPRSYLFEMDSGKPWSKESFLVWKNREFQQIFDKPVTTNIARHAYINAQNQFPQSIEKRRVQAESMGHSLRTQDEYRKIV
jgi:hypothetical protein